MFLTPSTKGSFAELQFKYIQVTQQVWKLVIFNRRPEEKEREQLAQFPLTYQGPTVITKKVNDWARLYTWQCVPIYNIQN